MKYVAFNGDTYMRYYEGNLDETISPEEACKFSTLDKCKNFIKCLPKKFKNYQETALFQTSYVEPQYIFENQEYSIEDVIQFLKNFESWYEGIISQKDFIERQLQTTEQSQQDLLHAIEFYRVDACKGYKLYNKLHEVREQRRRYKDALLIIDILKEYISDKILIDPPSERIIGMQNRKYRPRFLEDIFISDNENFS